MAYLTVDVARAAACECSEKQSQNPQAEACATGQFVDKEWWVR